MTGRTFFKSMNQLRKSADIKCKNSDGLMRDPEKLSDCTATASLQFDRLTQEQVDQIQPAVKRAVQAMAHILDKSLPDKDKAKCPFIIHLTDPLLRICSQEGISVSLNRPDIAAGSTARPPNSPPAATKGVAGLGLGQAHSEGHKGLTSQQQPTAVLGPGEGSTHGQALPPMSRRPPHWKGSTHAEGHGSGLQDHSSASIKLAVEHDFQANGSQGPMELIFEKNNGYIKLIIEVKWELETHFKEALTQITHQLSGAALHNASIAATTAATTATSGPGAAAGAAAAGAVTADKPPDSVNGMLTDGLKWVAFRFTPEKLPQGSTKCCVKGFLEYSCVYNIMCESGVNGLKVQMEDLTMVIYQLTRLLHTGADKLDIAASLDSYDKKLAVRTDMLMNGKGLLEEPDNWSPEPHESRLRKRSRSHSGNNPAAQQELHNADQAILKLSIEGRATMADAAYENAQQAVVNVLVAVQNRNSIEAFEKCHDVISSILLQLHNCVKYGDTVKQVSRPALVLEAHKALTALAAQDV